MSLDAMKFSSMKISVCITTFNRADELDNTLKSISLQTRMPDEIIVSDDASKDHTAEVVKKWSARLPGRIIYQRNSSNLGMPGNLNAAVRRARGDYIANLHDADVYDPLLLELWCDALERHPSAGLVFSGVGSRLDPSACELHAVAPLTAGNKFYEENYLHKWQSIIWGSVMVRREVYDRLLPFDSRYGFISDVDMWMRVCLRYDIAYVRRPLILLDHTPTATRGWVWRHKDATRSIQFDHIQRLYGSDPKALRRHLIIHRRLSIGIFTRGIAGGILRRDWGRVREGYSLWRGFFGMKS